MREFLSNDWISSVNPSWSVPNGIGFFGFNNSEGKHEFVKLGRTYSLQGLAQKYSPIGAIISNTSGMFSNGCFEVLNRKTKKYTRGEYKEWDTLLNNPNPFQTGIEFRKDLHNYLTIAGFVFVMKVFPYMMEGTRPSQLIILPPWAIKVKGKKNVDLRTVTKASDIREVWFEYNGIREQLDEKELILFKDVHACYTDPETQLPISRIENIEYPIANGAGAMKTRSSFIEDRGASGIISADSSDAVGPIPLDEDEFNRTKDMYKTRYGVREDQAKIIVTTNSVKWQSMTLSLKELLLHEEHRECIKDACDTLMFKYRLLSTSEGATYNNQKEDKVAVYQDNIIPQANNIVETLNIGLNGEANNVLFILTYDHVYVLKQGEKERGEGRRSMNQALKMEWDNFLISRNMWLLEIGRDQVGDPTDKNNPFNKYKNELTPEELGIVDTSIKEDNKKQNNNK